MRASRIAIGVLVATGCGRIGFAKHDASAADAASDATASVFQPVALPPGGSAVQLATGETAGSLYAVFFGGRMFHTTDGGKTFENMGLRTSRHINRIVIDPRDNDIVFVAATGSLWGPGGERGAARPEILPPCDSVRRGLWRARA